MAFTDMKKEGFDKYLPGLLTGFGIVSFLASIVTTALAVPKAMDDIYEAEIAKGGELDAFETVETAGKEFVVPLIFAVTGTACCVSSCALQYRYTAALVAAGTAVEHAYIDAKTMLANKIESNEEYRKQVAEVIGNEKEQEIAKRTDEEVANKSSVLDISRLLPPNGLETVDGYILCQDMFTKQRFWSNQNDIVATVNELNRCLNSGQDVTLNDWCSSIGIEPTSVGDDIYWEACDSRGLTCRLIEVYFGSALVEGYPVLTVGFVSGHGPRGRLTG